ncbi:MAG: type II toxin-antitoxin system Phd/YefM family antitoxin [Candidatus Sabulitectum sp.]|nr:type II toxin-antitoxin system Phd/YefM family antitoxin [Candidatus Sabulitectum sp.]
MRIPQIIPITDLRQGAASVLQQVRESDEPLVITQRGRPAVVLLSIEAYEKSDRSRRQLLLLAQGEKEILTGEGYSLESVMKEADQILNGEH